MSKIDEFKKKYKIQGVEEEEERKASSSPIEEFKKKYNITTTDEADKLGSYERSKRESKTSQVISSNFDRMGSSTGIDGYKKYLEDEEAKKTATKYDLNNDGQDSWWEKALGYLGGSGGGVVDTTLPTAGVTQAVHDLREDESYKRPSNDWSVKQKSEFGELYLTSPESAFAYAEKTNKQNNKRKEESEIDKIQREATKNFGYGVGHTVGAIATAPLGMADYLGDLAYAAAGRDIAPDGSVSPFEYSQAVTGGISEHLNEVGGTLPDDWWIVGGKGWGDVYGLGTSIAQSMASAYTLGSVGTLVSYFGQAAAAGVDDAIVRGATNEQALTYGAALGMFEGVAEMVGIDNLFKLGSASTVKGLIKNILNQAGAEGGEELFTAVTSEIADRWIMADKSNFNILVEELMAQGMSEADAKKKAFMSTLGDIAFDTIAGAVSGSVSGGIHSGVQTAITNADAKANYSGQAQDMVSEALASEDADTRTVGEKYQKKLNDNKKLSGWNISELLEVTDNSKVKSAVEAQLTKLGESGDVSTLAEVITKQTQGIELSKKEQAIIDGSKFGQRVVNTLKRENIKSGEYDTRWAKDIGTRRLNADVYNKSLSDHISDAVDAERKARLELRETDSVTENAASEENAAESEISPSVVVKNAEGKNVNAEIQSVEVYGDNVSFTLANGEKVDSDNVAFKSDNAKLVADIAVEKVSRVEGFSNEAATAMIKGYDGSIDPDRYATAFDLAYEMGANGAPASKLTRAMNLGVSDTVAYTAYELGRQSTKIVETGLNSLSENGIINTNESEAKNESGENVRLRNGGKRDGGKNTQRQVSRMESSTGQAESRRKASRIADSEAARLVNEGREVKVSDLGILGGSKEQTVRVVDKANETSSMKEARKRAEARGLKVKFFVGDNLVIKDKRGEWISSRAFIKGDHVFVRADHALYTADQLMRHELGHDMIAKGEVDIDAVRERLLETVGKENIDTVAEHYANAYAGTGMSADEIWEECICDSLGDMNIFAGEEAIGIFLDSMIPEIKAAASESKSANKTRGSPDGKASRETVPKRDKHLYASGVYFLHKNFPPENERLSEAHRLAVLWARNQNTVAGDQTLIFMNDVCYLVECFDDALNYYQVEDVISKAEFDNIYKEIKQYGRSGQIKSVQGSFDEYDKLYKSNNSSKTGKSGIDSNEARYGRENSKLVRVDSPENKRRERSSSDRGGDSQSSSEDRQKYSRELDTEYLSAVNRGDMETAQRMVDEAAKEAGYTVRGLHATNAEFNAFDISKTSAENFHGKGIYFTNSVRDLENNYENYEGPDPWQKIEGRAYELAYDKYGISYEDTLTSDSEIIDKLNECYDIAIDEFKKSGRRITAYLRFDNPLILEKGMQIPYDYAGYDGIIDKQVYENIGHSGMDENTIHYVVFNPNNIKSADPVTYDDDGNVIPLSERFNPKNSDIRYSRELDFIDFINEQAGEESDPNLTKTQQVAKVRGELERMNVGKGEIMSVMKLSDKMFDLYGGDSSISDFRYGLFEATKLALNGSETGFEAAYDIIHTLASEVAYNPKDIGGEADVLAQIKKDIRGTKLAVHEKDKTSGEFDKYGGYGVFRKSHLGKFMLANDGVQVDAKYAELQNLYGEDFFPEVNTVSEQLLQMAKLMDTPLSDYMMVSDAELQATADGMVQSLFATLGDIWSRAINSGKTIVAPVESDKFSNRSLLVGALETTVQNDIEKNKLEQYKEKIALINSEEQKLLELRTKIKELSFAKGKRDTEAIRQLQFEANQAANRINTYDKQLLNLESTKALRGVLEREKALARKRDAQKYKEALERYREKSAKTQRELMDRYQESRKKATEGRNKTAMRHKIKDVVSELNTLLLKPTAKKHIKEELRREVAEALSAINMDTIDADARVAMYNDLIAKEKNPDVIAELTKTRDRIQLQGDNLKEKLNNLQSAYEKIKNTDDIELNLAYQEVIQNSIKAVSEKIGNTSIRNMTLEQLEMVYDLFSMIRKTVRDANKSFKEKKGQTIMQMAEAVNDQVRTVGGQPYKRNAISASLQRVGWTFLKPFVAFRTIGSITLTNMYKELRNGEDTFYGDVKEAQAFIEGQKNKHGYKSWDMKKTKTFTAKSGKSFDLTLEQIMSLYAYSKRDQAHEHIIQGGIVFEDALLVEKNKAGIPIKYEVTTKDAFNLSEETFAEIANSLTAEQKAFVDEMQAYLSDTMGAKGNEVSMELLGVKLFKEKFYLPIKSSQYYMNFKAEEAGEVKLKSPAFSKETVQHANNPIVIHNFTDLWAEHINDMSMYHSFVLALEDFTRVYNYKTKTDAKVETMDTKATLETAYPGVTKYINKFLKDMNGGVRGETVGWAEKLTSLSKKGAVLGSASVTIQQPSAVMRAMALVNPKYFVTTAHKSINLLKHKEDFEELKKYAPIAGIKEMGRFDVGMGQGTVDWIKSDKTVLDKAEDILSMPPAFMDEVTWVSIWNAVKRETLHNHNNLSPKSEEFLKIAGERFTEVISMSQVYDSVFSKSDIMRNKSWIAKSLTAFMAEPTTQLNMIWDSWVQAKRSGTVKGYVKATASTGGAIVAATVLNAALKSVITAMRDDDEDESYIEKYLEHFVGDLKDSLNPLGLIPFVKDIVSIFRGYDVERMDMALFSDFKSAIDAFDSDSKTLYEKWSGFIGATAAFFGVPVKNVERDIRGLITTVFGETEETTVEGMLNAIKKGWTGEESSNGQQLYEAMLKGDSAQVNRIEGRFENQSKIDTAIKKALRENDPRINMAAECLNAGDLRRRDVILDTIVAEGHFDEKLVGDAIRAEANAIKEESEGDSADSSDDDKDEVYSIYQANDINVAFESGDTALAKEIIQDLIDTKVANGMDEKKAKSSLRSSMTSYWKPLYKMASQAEKTRIRKILYNSGLYGTVNDVVKTAQDWLKD